MLQVQQVIKPLTGKPFTCVVDLDTLLPVGPIQRYLNYCFKRQLAVNTIKTYADRLIVFWRYLHQVGIEWEEVSLDDLASFANWYLMGGITPISVHAQEVNAHRSERTVNQAITVIQELYKFHTAEGRINHKDFTTVSTYRPNRSGGFLKGIAKSNLPHKKKSS